MTVRKIASRREAFANEQHYWWELCTTPSWTVLPIIAENFSEIGALTSALQPGEVLAFTANHPVGFDLHVMHCLYPYETVPILAVDVNN